LRNPPVDIRKYQQAFLAPLPGKATGIEFIRLNLLARLFLVILVGLSFFPHILSLPYMIVADMSIHDFSTPSAAKVATGPDVINGDANFELKPALITMFKLVHFVRKPIGMQMLTSNISWRFVAHSPLRE
jgi:hypothetical protein